MAAAYDKLLVGNTLNAASTSLAVSTTAASTSGADIFVAIFTNGAATSSVTDSASNTYAQVGTDASNGSSVVALYRAKPAGVLASGATVTINFATSANRAAAIVFSATGVDRSASPIDVGPTNGTSFNNTTQTSSSVTTTASGDFEIALLGSQAGAAATLGTITGGFTLANGQTTNTGGDLAALYKVGGAAGAEQAGGTWSTSQAGADQSSLIVAFKAAAGGSPPGGGSCALSGTQKVGSTLTATASGFTNTPTSYTFTWQRADDSGFTTNVTTIRGPNTGAGTTDNYTLTSAEDGKYVRAQVFATNGSGDSGTVNSSASSQITYPVPTNTVAPVIAGTPQVGSTLTETQGTWTP